MLGAGAGSRNRNQSRLRLDRLHNTGQQNAFSSNARRREAFVLTQLWAYRNFVKSKIILCWFNIFCFFLKPLDSEGPWIWIQNTAWPHWIFVAHTKFQANNSMMSYGKSVKKLILTECLEFS